MALKWSEIKKWAAKHDLKPKKVGDEYVWEENAYKDLKELTFALYNHITNNKYVEYQKNYAAQILNTDNIIK